MIHASQMQYNTLLYNSAMQRVTAILSKLFANHCKNIKLKKKSLASREQKKKIPEVAESEEVKVSAKIIWELENPLASLKSVMCDILGSI